LQKLQPDSTRIGRLPYIVVQQEEVGELCAVEGRRWADPRLLEARRFGCGVRVKGRAGEASAAEPEAAAADLVRVSLAGNQIGAHALGRPAAGKASDGEIETAPEEVHGARLADEARPELLQDVVRREQDPPGAM